MMQRMRKLLKLDEIDEAKKDMYTAATRAAASSGLFALAIAQNHEQIVRLNDVLQCRGNVPIVVAGVKDD